MGDGTRAARSERFIAEFSKDYEDIYSNGGLPESVVSAGLVVDDNLCVRYFIELKKRNGDVLMFVEDHVIFEPDSDDDILIEYVADELDIEMDTARERLTKARLVRAMPSPNQDQA